LNLPLHNEESETGWQSLFADVIVPVPIPQYFTYKIPHDLTGQAGVGCRVIIQFGRKNIHTGIIARLHHKPPEKYEARAVLDVLDDIPHITALQLKLFHWMAEYYMCTIGEVVKNALPSGLKLSSESHIEIHPEFDFYSSSWDFSDKEMKILDALSAQKSLTYKEIGNLLNIKSYQPVIRSLMSKEAILIYEHVREKYSPKREKIIRIRQERIQDKQQLEHLVNELESKPKQLDVMLAYLQKVPVLKDPDSNDQGIWKRQLLKSDISPSSLNTLVKKKILEETEIIVPRFEIDGPTEDKPIRLSTEQELVRNDIHGAFQRHQTVLMHGVTGSGKTEIYIELIRDALLSGGQALYILPEIALTTQIVNRLKQYFGNTMGIYHSKYSDNERVEVWKGVLSGKYQLVVGVRSSVLLPFDNLNLIIVDEEHEISFKQFDTNPRYHARDVSQMLARIHNSKVLLGSATPSVESYYLSTQNKYGRVELHKRYGNASMPDILFADLTKERKEKTIRNDFASRLIEQISDALSKKEQVIIFQNRRGYAPFITCEECAWIPKCEHCSVSLTYHMYAKVIICHYCGFKEQLPDRCPACGAQKIKVVGYGTEKIEEDLKFFFPEANVRRMDLDTTRRKFSYNQIISDFELGNIDILVGTQMVSKGLDFDNVSTVGVLDVDRMLHFPDFRSFERTYQLVTQVSGRAGRREKEGKVIIQTANVNQQPLKWIAGHDYKAMFDFEIGERKKFHYPPFFRLIKIIFKHKEKEISERAANHMASLLREAVGTSLILDPHEPMIARIKNLYLMEILIKADRKKIKLDVLKAKLIEARDKILLEKDFKQVQVVFDVDPY